MSFKSRAITITCQNPEGGTFQREGRELADCPGLAYEGRRCSTWAVWHLQSGMVVADSDTRRGAIAIMRLACDGIDWRLSLEEMLRTSYDRFHEVRKLIRKARLDEYDAAEAKRRAAYSRKPKLVAV